MILGLLDEAQVGGARLAPSCEVLGLDLRTVQRWKRQDIGDDGRAGPLQKPANALSAAERKRILDLANTPEFRDKSPKQIVPTLADQGEYYASESTMYRVLREADQLHHRTPAKAPAKRHRPAPCTATGPNQVWSWDITYLRTTVKGSFYYLYMVLDVWSRKIVGYEVHTEECSELAAWLLEVSCDAERVAAGSLVLHSDNGSPMKAATMLAKLQELGVATSFSRPSASNDNPFSESAFRTAKYRPDFPSRPFESLEGARLGRRLRALVQHRAPAQLDQLRRSGRPTRRPRCRPARAQGSGLRARQGPAPGTVERQHAQLDARRVRDTQPSPRAEGGDPGLIDELEATTTLTPTGAASELGLTPARRCIRALLLCLRLVVARLRRGSIEEVAAHWEPPIRFETPRADFGPGNSWRAPERKATSK